MRLVDSFPHEVREIENAWIPLSDGCRLAARIWMPANAPSAPVPAVLEYIPYRKRDGTRWRDEPMHRWFAGHGYAAVRVDLRGSGDSDGLLADEYTEQEHADAAEVIRWIAAQPWCSGKVGMMGKSWGGFNALQVAARRPPGLAAVITVCASDDRYRDDAHYMGGCLLNENLIWGSVLLTLAAQPPDPQLVGGRWRSIWRERLETAPLFPALWLRHPHRDRYWKRGSVCEDYAAVACPVWAVGGWADAYTNGVPRLLAGLAAPRKGLVGPWAHVYPHRGVPGPAIGFLQEALAWWDRWLRGRDNGVDREPFYRVWMAEGRSPGTPSARRPGRWVAEEAWPSPRIRTRRMALAWEAGGGRLGTDPGPEVALTHRSPETAGSAAGSWCPFGAADLPGDQADDDRVSLTFDSEPLAERLEILGAPEVELELAADRPWALLAVRLCDAAPDGSSERVTYALLNLAHRGGHERPRPLVPGSRVRVRLALNHAAHAFLPGRRIRLALATACWPIAWPPPWPATLTVFAGKSSLLLPVRPPRPEDAALRPFAPPEAATPSTEIEWGDAPTRREVRRDPASGETVILAEAGFAPEGGPALSRLEPLGLETGHAIAERFSIREGDPGAARAELSHHTATRRGAWSVRVATAVRMTATERAFRLEGELWAWEGEEEVCARRWDEAIPRRLV